jgi:hypothetical protein
VVNTNLDDPNGPQQGVTTFRDAINNANANTNPDGSLITFQIPSGGPQTIQLQQDLPVINNANNFQVTIDGSTQTGSPAGIELNGNTEVGTPGQAGLEVISNSVTIGGLQIDHFSNGIIVDPLAANITIGGTSSQARNVLFDNNNAINYSGLAAFIQNNYIGVRADGDTAGDIAQSTGILDQATDGSAVLIGGPGAGNVISGNMIGINVEASGTTIQGNLIGPDHDADAAIPNTAFGILSQADNTIIGGQQPGQGNVIDANAIGVSIMGQQNLVSGNSIDDNGPTAPGVYGIVLQTNANNNQAAPVLTSATATSDTTVLIRGKLTGTLNTTYTLEFFTNSSGTNTQGKQFLGASQFFTGPTGTINFTAAEDVSPGSPPSFITATATDANNNTSEFSNAVAFGGTSGGGGGGGGSSSSTNNSLTVTPGNVMALLFADLTALFTSLFSNPGAAQMEFQLFFDALTLFEETFTGGFDTNLAQQAANLAQTLDNTPGSGFHF